MRKWGLEGHTYQGPAASELRKSPDRLYPSGDPNCAGLLEVTTGTASPVGGFGYLVCSLEFYVIMVLEAITSPPPSAPPPSR